MIIAADATLNGRIRIWDSETWELLQSLEVGMVGTYQAFPAVRICLLSATAASLVALHSRHKVISGHVRHGWGLVLWLWDCC